MKTNIRETATYKFDVRASDGALTNESVRKMNYSGVFLTCFIIISRIKLNKWSHRDMGFSLNVYLTRIDGVLFLLFLIFVSSFQMMTLPSRRLHSLWCCCFVFCFRFQARKKWFFFFFFYVPTHIFFHFHSSDWIHFRDDEICVDGLNYTEWCGTQ